MLVPVSLFQWEADKVRQMHCRRVTPHQLSEPVPELAISPAIDSLEEVPNSPDSPILTDPLSEIFLSISPTSCDDGSSEDTVVVNNYSPSHSRMITRAASEVFKPNPNSQVCPHRSSFGYSGSQIPKLALMLPKWREAMSNEFKVLTKNGTWILIPRLKEDNINI